MLLMVDVDIGHRRRLHHRQIVRHALDRLQRIIRLWRRGLIERVRRRNRSIIVHGGIRPGSSLSRLRHDPNGVKIRRIRVSREADMPAVATVRGADHIQVGRQVVGGGVCAEGQPRKPDRRRGLRVWPARRDSA